MLFRLNTLPSIDKRGYICYLSFGNSDKRSPGRVARTKTGTNNDQSGGTDGRLIFSLTTQEKVRGVPVTRSTGKCDMDV